MSRILVDQVRSNTASGDAITLDGNGKCAINATTINSLTFPTSDGSANQLIKTNGSGALSFVDSAAGGKVLQVVNNSSNTNVTTSGNTVSDLLTTAITPASASNKVLVFLTANTWVNNGGINAFGGLRLYRGANSSGTQIYDMEGGLNATTAHWQVFYFNYLDSPNTTSAQSYTMSIRRYSSHTTSVATDGKYYQMMLMEIAA